MLGLYLAVETSSRLVRERVFSEDTLSDLLVNLTQSRIALAHLAYPEPFYYPPPYVLIQRGLWSLGLPAATAVWYAAIVGSGLAVAWLTLDALGLRRDPRRGPIALAAFITVLYFVQWDLRTANSNLIVLAMVLASLRWGMDGRPVRAGAAWALAVAFKLYAAIWLPWLVAHRRGRWLAAGLLGLAFLFVALPVAALGPTDALALTRAWLASLASIGPPLSLPDVFKPLDRSLLLWLTEAGADRGGAALRLAPESVIGLARGLQALWLGLVAVALWRARRREPPRERAWLEVAVLMFAPLPFSPTFQAHHAVVALLPAFWLVREAADPAAPRGRRIEAALWCVAPALLVKVVDDWPARAVAIFAALALWLGALVRFAAAARPVPPPAAPASTPPGASDRLAGSAASAVAPRA